MIKLFFSGADHEVTGSMHLLQTDELNILIDCGMEQGKNYYKNEPIPVAYSDLDYIVLTHAHIDHAGLIPMAYAKGFRGTVLATSASMDLDRIMLLDSAHIQETDAENENKKARRQGRPETPPLYTLEDAKNALDLFRPIPYEEEIELSDHVSLHFVDAGHLLGSASAFFTIRDGSETRKIVFSGDIGNLDKPLIRDPQYIHEEVDYVVSESTYGYGNHDKNVDHLEDLRRIVQDTLDRGGNVVIPAFAVGRTQELLFFFRKLKQDHMIKGHEGFPVVVDSPLAVEATNVFKESLIDFYDEETRELVKKGINPISFKDLRLVVSNEESRALNIDPTPKILIAAAGMCNAGRIRHHLRHNLWREESSVVFAGYQAFGTLGRKLVDGAETLRLFGEDVAVKAHIETMGAMSSHADQDGLLAWASAFPKPPKKYFLVHGEDDAMEIFSALLREKLGYSVSCPYSGSVFNLLAGEFEYTAEPQYLSKVTKIMFRNDAHKDKLQAALADLSGLVEKQLEGTNADIDKLTEEINKLVKKYSFK